MPTEAIGMYEPERAEQLFGGDIGGHEVTGRRRIGGFVRGVVPAACARRVAACQRL
jgi:hypothetical protein